MSAKDKNEVKVNIPEELKVPQYVNTFRLGFSEDEFILDFGNRVPETNEINIVSRMSFSVDKMKNLILACWEAGTRYEKEYQKDIGGFTLNINEENK